MRLWTLQPPEVWEELESTGRFVCDENKSENLKDRPFIIAYDWLVSKMKEKIGLPPVDVKYPIWAWHSWNGKNKKPDLRRSEFQFGKKGTRWVCIELEISDDKVVLSDEPSWSCYVLNGDYFNTEVTDDKWEEKEEWFDNLPNEEKEKIRVSSWDNVFDVEPFENDFCSKGMYVQATFWELKKEYVKNHTYFVSK